MPNLTDEDKTLLEKLLNAGHIEYKCARRLQIVLQRDKGQSAQEIAGNSLSGVHLYGKKMETILASIEKAKQSVPCFVWETMR